MQFKEKVFTKKNTSIAKALMQKPQKQVFYVNQLIPENKVISLVSAGGTGKTQLAIQIGVAVVTGLSLANKFQIEKTGNVVMVATEESKEDLAQRIRHVVQYHVSGIEDKVKRKKRTEKTFFAYQEGIQNRVCWGR